MSPNSKIVFVKELTEGAACTTLLAEKYIDNSGPLIIGAMQLNCLTVFLNLEGAKLF